MPQTASTEHAVPSARTATLSSLTAAAPLAGLTLFGLDRVAAIVMFRDGVVPPLRLNGLVSLWALHTLTALVGVVALAASWWVAGRIRRGPAARAWVAGALLAVLAIWPSIEVGRQLASGEWIARQWFSWMVVVGPATVATFAISVGARIGFSAADTSERRQALTAGVMLGVAGIAAIGDVLVMPGLHSAFHLAVYGVEALLAGGAAVLVLLVVESRIAGRHRRPRLAAAVLLTVLAVVAWSMASDRVRVDLLNGSPPAQHLIRAIAGAQGPRLGEGVMEAERTQAAKGRRGLILVEDASVVLITIDTLRYDTMRPNLKETSKFGNRTPFLHEWSRDSVTFRRAYAHAPHTAESVPALLRSTFTGEDPLRVGVPVARTMGELGLSSAAIVPVNFMQPGHAEDLHHVLDEFEHMTIYGHHDQFVAQHVDDTLTQMDADDDRPKFLWIHYLAIHSPGFAGRQLSDDDGSWKERYLMSLEAVDEDLRTLTGVLEKHGVLPRAVVVVASDHGENLGANGFKTHATSLYEEEVRVPLAIRIPGQPGRVVEQTVGNVDILPTIVDLLGAPEVVAHRGKSLVPLLAQDAVPWDETYYIASNRKKLAMDAIVIGTDKLIYDRKAALFSRYDVDADPREKENLYDPSGSVDAALQRAMLEYRPALAQDELRSEKQVAAVRDELARIDPLAPPDDLEFTLARLSVTRDPDSLVRLHTLFVEGDDEFKIRVSRKLASHLGKTFRDWNTDRILELADSQAELEYIRRLADIGHPRLRHEVISKRIQHWVEHGEPTQWRPWFDLVDDWDGKKARLYGPVLAPALESLSDSDDTAALRALLRVVCSLRGGSTDDPFGGRIRVDLLQLTRHQDRDAARLAFCGLEQFGRVEDLAVLEEAARDESVHVQVRQAAIHALAAIGGERAVEPLVEIGRSSELLRRDVVAALRDIGLPAGLPYLRDVAENDYHWVTRKWASDAVKRIERKEKD